MVLTACGCGQPERCSYFSVHLDGVLLDELGVPGLHLDLDPGPEWCSDVDEEDVDQVLQEQKVRIARDHQAFLRLPAKLRLPALQVLAVNDALTVSRNNRLVT